uniref:uroporphyrinogen-III synthase n=1 Tax=Myxine glutinosa TaxID=7769 RepID=UPI00358F4D8A
MSVYSNFADVRSTKFAEKVVLQMEREILRCGGFAPHLDFENERGTTQRGPLGCSVVRASYWLARISKLSKKRHFYSGSMEPQHKRSAATTRVLLLKEARETDNRPDPYLSEFSTVGMEATVVPALEFSFINLESLRTKVMMNVYTPDKFASIVFTSPRAVQAVKQSLQKHPVANELSGWASQAVFAVGDATAMAVRELGLHPMGQDSGSADKLADVIIEKFVGCTLPILFPCGTLRRQELPNKLQQHGISVDSLVVYETKRHSELDTNLESYFLQQGVPDIVVFFSPSGVRFALKVLRSLAGENFEWIKFAAIGDTTATALDSAGSPACFKASRPTPRALLVAIANGTSQQ